MQKREVLLHPEPRSGTTARWARRRQNNTHLRGEVRALETHQRKAGACTSHQAGARCSGDSGLMPKTQQQPGMEAPHFVNSGEGGCALFSFALSCW